MIAGGMLFNHSNHDNMRITKPPVCCFMLIDSFFHRYCRYVFLSHYERTRGKEMFWDIFTNFHNVVLENKNTKMHKIGLQQFVNMLSSLSLLCHRKSHTDTGNNMKCSPLPQPLDVTRPRTSGRFYSAKFLMEHLSSYIQHQIQFWKKKKDNMYTMIGHTAGLYLPYIYFLFFICWNRYLRFNLFSPNHIFCQWTLHIIVLINFTDLGNEAMHVLALTCILTKTDKDCALQRTGTHVWELPPASARVCVCFGQ